MAGRATRRCRRHCGARAADEPHRPRGRGARAEAISGVRLHGSWPTLRAVFDQNITAQQMPEMFAFGLLAEFDVEQMRQLVAPRPVVVE